jgi:hypothetical protein
MMKADGKKRIVWELVVAFVLAIISGAVLRGVEAAMHNIVAWNWIMTIAIPVIVGGVAFFAMRWDDRIRLQLEEVRTKLEALPTADALRADLLTRQDDRFDSLRRDEVRHKAALTIWRRENLGDVEDVLDFFDDIGGYLKRKLLDEESVSDHYSYWVVRYAAFTRDYISRRRDELHSSEYWESFDELDVCMRKLNPEELGHYTDEQRQKFLAEEGVTDEEFERVKT